MHRGEIKFWQLEDAKPAGNLGKERLLGGAQSDKSQSTARLQDMRAGEVLHPLPRSGQN